MSRGADLALGAAALALAGGYGAMAYAIPPSLLADAVGPGGVPLMIAGLMAASGAGLILRTLLVGAGEAGRQPDHPRAAGLLGLLVLYTLAVPFLGYPLAIFLLAAAVAWFGGARGRAVVLFALGLAVLFWAIFVALLGVPFPAGHLFGGL
jgi:putative tricarboxylic transport membrane protein